MTRKKGPYVWLTGLLFGIMLLGILAIRESARDSFEFKTILAQEWLYVHAGREELITLPCSSQLGKGETGILSGTLPPETKVGDILCFFTGKQQVSVTIGNKTVYQWEPKSYPENALSLFHFIPLDRSCGGEKFSILLTNTYSRFPNTIETVYLGSIQDVLHDLWRCVRSGVGLCIVVFLVGMIAVVLSFYYREDFKAAHSIRFTGWFLIALSLWGIIQTGLLYLLYGRLLLLLLEQLSLLSMPVLIVIAVQPLGRPLKSKWEYDGFCVLFCLYLMLSVLLDVLGFIPLPDMSLWSILFFSIFIVYIGVFGVVESSSNAAFSESQRTLDFSLFLSVVFCVLLTVFLGLYFSLVRLRPLMLGLGYVLTIGITVLLFWEMRALLRLQDELAQSQMHLLLSQIKPHFLYNTLNSIRTLIRTDSDTADHLVYNFSRFLRSNMQSINSAKLIPFSRELDHINSYVKIEETCFPKLTVQFDIQVHNFSVPPLSIQPLVENAIKHGVLKKAAGGTVYLRTYEQPDAYCVEVQDSGVGFQVDQILYESDIHGLENVKLRLEYYCDAKLEIVSAPGRGCTAFVRIPKQRKGRRDDAHDPG